MTLSYQKRKGNIFMLHINWLENCKEIIFQQKLNLLKIEKWNLLQWYRVRSEIEGAWFRFISMGLQDPFISLFSIHLFDTRVFFKIKIIVFNIKGGLHIPLYNIRALVFKCKQIERIEQLVQVLTPQCNTTKIQYNSQMSVSSASKFKEHNNNKYFDTKT